MPRYGRFWLPYWSMTGYFIDESRKTAILPVSTCLISLFTSRESERIESAGGAGAFST